MAEFSGGNYKHAWDLYRERYGTMLPQSQIINWTLYDTLTYTSGTTTLLTYFNAIRATRNLGNMEVASVIPHPKAFIIRAIGVRPLRNTVLATTAADAFNDLKLLVDNGWFVLTIGNKEYGVWTLDRLPGGGGVWADSAGAGGEATDEFISHAEHGIPSAQNMYTLSQPLLIDPNINFNVTLNWAAAQTLTADANIRVYLDGEMIRPVQ